MSRDVCNEATFLKDVQQHQMTVMRDDGIHRHIRFAKPGTRNMHFDLITWPGYLCYTGDMGTFVFSRMLDMFQFFRTERQGLQINPRYWSEKLQADSIHGGFKEFSIELFKQQIADYLDQHDASADVRDAVDAEILNTTQIHDGEYPACKAVYDFDHEGFRFQDFFERTMHEYTYHFLWCCYALSWGIQQYDRERSKLAAASMRDGNEWPGGLVWTIGGIRFVEFDDALRAVRGGRDERHSESSKPNTNDMAMLIRQLVHVVNKVVHEAPVAYRAMQYLKRYGMEGSPLRDSAEERRQS